MSATHSSLVLLLSAIAAGTPQPGTRAAVHVDYLLHHAAADKQWQITVTVRGLDAGRGRVTLNLDDWGGWPAEKTLHPRVLESQPRVTVDGPTQLSVAEAVHGSLRVKYAIPVSEWESEPRRRCGLRPWCTDTYVCGFSNNTLMSVFLDGKPVAAQRTVTLTAAPSTTIVTGWAGAAEGTQTVVLDHDIDNSLIYFGAPTATARAQDGGVTVEVFQFGAGRDITQAVLDTVRKLVPAYGSSTGRKRDTPARVCINDRGGGGVRVDHGLAVSWTPSDDPTEHSRYFQLTVAHELFHDWIGGYLTPPGEATVWFHEGFTDYLALWHLAQNALVPREWFAERLAEIDVEARASTAFGHVAFADQVDWRDGDGPRETLAYKGGAMLAFFLDVALREAGHRGVPHMIGDLIKAKTYTLASLEAWLLAHGLRDFYAAHIARPGLPDLREALAIIGFEQVASEQPLTYLGIRATSEPFGTITALDPDGPAAHAGAKVGDVITGFWPTRAQRPELTDAVTTTYRFGLSWFDPEAKRVSVGVRRGNGELTLGIGPRRIAGGRALSWRADPELVGDFFAP